jgi:hypothetical protein
VHIWQPEGPVGGERPKYSAETEYSVPPAETKSQNSAFLNILSKEKMKQIQYFMEEIQIMFK